MEIPLLSSSASHIIISKKMLKWVGEGKHPCRTSAVVLKQFPVLPLNRTALWALVIQIFNDSSDVGIDIEFAHGCP